MSKSSKIYYQKHPEKKKEHDKKYYESHKEEILKKEKEKHNRKKTDPEYRKKINASNKKWRDKNPDYHKKWWNSLSEEEKQHHKEMQAISSKKWKEEHPEEHKRNKREYQRIRNARIRAGDYTLRKIDWEIIKDNYNYTCVLCGRSEPDVKLTIDHIVPISKGGDNYIDNIQPLCMKCNRRKSNQIIF